MEKNFVPGLDIQSACRARRRCSTNSVVFGLLLAVSGFNPSLFAEDPSPPAASPGPLTEREQYFLKEIQALKAKLAELESQLTGATDGNTVAIIPASLATPKKDANATNLTPPSAAPAADQQTAANNPAPATQEKPAPFSFADFTWLNGTPRNHDSPLDSKYFSGEFRADTSYIYDYNHPIDHSLSGTTEGARTGEFQVQHLGVGGDFHVGNMQGRILTQFGIYSTATPRNDASPGLGQWNLSDAYRYVTEAYGGYHLNVQNGINIQAGIFMSYVGLFSYYNFDNWTYQPSYVSSNTPWFFNGMRIQWFPNQKLKIEPWLINGWQSYGKFNGRPGIGAQVLYRPNGWLSFVGNQYGVGQDTLGLHRTRWHTDDSVEVKYYEVPANLLDRMALSLTIDAGCESGGGVSCFGAAGHPKQTFLGFMLYNRWWFHKDLFAVTIGGGAMDNPGRYLVLLPPINGATAFTGTPYFTENPGQPFRAWDAQSTFDFMPSQFVTWRFEYTHRAANVPYFSGTGGLTPPGGNTGGPTQFIPGWSPDLRKRENRLIIALLVKL
jgi:hypothetical protein